MAVTLTCPECHREFKVPPSHVARRRYCSRECLRDVLNRETRPHHSAPWLHDVNDARKRPRVRDRREEYQVKKKFVQKTQYAKMLKAQNGLCAICGNPPTPDGHGPRRLCVDHDHETGAVRGLLCNSCNLALGLFHDDVTRLLSSIKYLEASR